MKHPRDVILDRHRHAEPRLNAVRSAVLSLSQTQHADPDSPAEENRRFVLAQVATAFWRELILPCRRTWIGFAAIWVFLAVVNFQMQPTHSAQFSSVTANALTPEIRAQLIRQYELRASLLESDITQPEENKDDRPSGKLRSAIRREWMAA
jgi:hypothetical protein